MVDLKTMIKNECEEDRTLATRIAKLAGYKNPNSLYKFLNEKDRECDDLLCVLQIVRELFPDREYEVMDQFLRTLKPSKQCARQGLEYAHVNKLYGLFSYLLEELKNCANKESQEWAAVYKIDWDVINGKTNQVEALELINEIQIKTNEMKVFSKIVKFYLYNDLRLIGIMNETSNLLEESLQNLDNGYIKSSYEFRYAVISSDVLLHTGETKKLREIVTIIINKINNKNLLARLYHHLGCSYILEDYDKANEFFNKGLNLVTHHDLTKNEIKRSMNLNNSFWMKGLSYIEVNNDENSYLADLGFNTINKSKTEAVELLEKVNSDKFSNMGKGFYFYYLGLVKQDIELLYQSVDYFVLSGEKYYRKMPLLELKKLGENERALKSLSL